MLIQSRLKSMMKLKTTYGRPQYNAIKENIQRIETHRGCPHNHPYCYEPMINVDFPIPEIVKNKVQILDMNFLCRKNVIETIKKLGKIKVNGKVVYYEAICGFDFRFITQTIANELKKARFKKIRLAWDGQLKEQYKIKDSIQQFIKAKYNARDISLFMLVNWKISKKECERKLDLMKVWNVKVCDCCYDGGYKYAIPKYWTSIQLKDFRRKCRIHNQLVNFRIYPKC